MILIDTNQRYEELKESIAACTEELILISPYLNYDLMKRLLEHIQDDVRTIVVSRWELMDFVRGANDLRIYPLLKNKNIPLFINYNLHAKLISFDRQEAIIGSANLTNPGYQPEARKKNIESTSKIQLSIKSYNKLLMLIEESTQVNDILYENYKSKIDKLNKQFDEYKRIEQDVQNNSIDEALIKFLRNTDEIVLRNNETIKKSDFLKNR
jgi:hypothetical protein